MAENSPEIECNLNLRAVSDGRDYSLVTRIHLQEEPNARIARSKVGGGRDRVSYASGGIAGFPAHSGGT